MTCIKKIIKLLIPLLVFSTIRHEVFSQSNKSIDYNEGTIEIVTFKDSKPIDTKPIGLNVGLSYNIFFKYYVISYVDESEKLTIFKLRYVRTDGKTKIMRWNNTERDYFVKDEDLASNGLFVLRAIDDDTNISIVISGLKPYVEGNK